MFHTVKFENIMFENSSANSEVKIIDFGLSKKFLPGDKERVMTEGVGTIYTMAPQVIKGVYTSQADLWSLGVITFMLLASEKPFYDRRRHRMMELIKSCSYSFDSPIWQTVSNHSKDFIRKLLVYDPKKRMDALTALQHPWLAMKAELSERRPENDLMEKIQNNLLAYRHTSTLKKVALNVIAHKSSPLEIYQLRRIFCQYDSSNDGTISFDEFKQALKESQYTDKELEEIFSSIDVNADGVIMYTGKMVIYYLCFLIALTLIP
jgi:calcium-dependent protein kinase